MTRFFAPFAVVACIIGHPIGAHGQFHALPDSNAVWAHHSYNPWGFDWQIAYCIEPYHQDTLINDTLYTILMECDPWSGYPSVYRGGIFDNNAGQVYYIHHDTPHASLLYDFDVLPGDSVEVAFSGGDPFMMFIGSVDTLAIAGSPRKRIGVQSRAAILGGQGIVHWWVQGIGGTNGLLETDGNLTLDLTSGLECMSTNDTIWWSWEPNGSPGNCLTVGIEENGTIEERWFHPTVSSDALYLRDGLVPRTVEVFSLDGRLQLKPVVHGNALSVTALESGGYVLRMVDAEGRIHRGRFLKE